jgi:hypothetical protein
MARKNKCLADCRKSPDRLSATKERTSQIDHRLKSGWHRRVLGGLRPAQ